ncbi:MAG: tetratricopeptide repeat protein [Alphaproteobacteria bacterium]
MVALADVVKARPEHVGALCALGTALQRLGRDDEATGYLDLATRLHPASVRAWVALGGNLLLRGRNQEARDAFRRAVACDGGDVRALSGLGAAAQACMAHDEAEAAYRRALALAPDDTTLLGNLGTLLVETGRQGAAQQCLQAAVDRRPDDAVLISNRLFAALYDETAAPQAIATLHRRRGGRLRAPAPAAVFAGRDAAPDRRLTVGYLSPDFRRHPVGFFLHDVLPAHDRAAVAVHALYDNTRRDWMTEALQAGVDGWHPVAGLDDRALAQRIAELGIDVLVDLAGHTRDNRLPLFAGRAAPVQVTWAGYAGTTGVPAMDAILLDPFVAAGAEPGDYTETVIADLPVYACYAPPPYAPPVRLDACAPDAAVTFGCFANAAKLNPRMAETWGRILRHLPGARLAIRTHACADAAVRDRFAAMFAEAGIAGERLLLEGPTAHEELLARVAEVDIVLDTFPYSGSTTAMEALWMGVPVVTLAGRLYHERHGGAVLFAAGLDALIAETEDDYVDLAVSLAHDAGARRQLRASLRDRLAVSPLRDGAGMARALEGAYRRLWRDRCANDPAARA